MIENHTLCTMFVETGGFQELDEPVIVTSGMFLTPFFCNAENLCGDPDIRNILARYAGAPEKLHDYLKPLLQTNPSYAAVMEKICRLLRDYLKGSKNPAVSGGQRRDWIFSMPAADILGVPHITLFKADSEKEHTAKDLSGVDAVHVVDLITKGSSIFSKNPVSGLDRGWVPSLKRRGADVSETVAVVSRCQGGEELMKEKGVRVTSLIHINKEFLSRYSSAPEENINYTKNPRTWTEKFLREKGIEFLFSYFEENEKKLPRVQVFIREYKEFLQEIKVLDKIESEYNKKIDGPFPWR